MSDWFWRPHIMARGRKNNRLAQKPNEHCQMAGVYSGFTNVVIEAAFRSPCHSIDPSFANAHLHAIAKSMNYYVHTRTLEHTHEHTHGQWARMPSRMYSTLHARFDTTRCVWLGGCRRFGQNSSVYNACVSIASSALESSNHNKKTFHQLRKQPSVRLRTYTKALSRACVWLFQA